MTKCLYVVRHAKSSWDNPGLRDFDRPLNSRGERDAPRIGQYLKLHEVLPDFLLSSPANRALTTANIIAGEIGYSGAIQTDRSIYHADEDTLLNAVKKLDNGHQSAMIFGHNPGFTDFVNGLTDAEIDNIPTCGVCKIEFRMETWADVKFGTGKLIFFQYPKGL
ncbi:MAG: histidine phosphatase family protein [Cyclobacteriaceae bacterium]